MDKPHGSFCLCCGTCGTRRYRMVWYDIRQAKGWRLGMLDAWVAKNAKNAKNAQSACRNQASPREQSYINRILYTVNAPTDDVERIAPVTEPISLVLLPYQIRSLPFLRARAGTPRLVSDPPYGLPTKGSCSANFLDLILCFPFTLGDPGSPNFPLSLRILPIRQSYPTDSP